MDTVIDELVKAGQLGLLMLGICGTILLLMVICDHYFGTDPED